MDGVNVGLLTFEKLSGFVDECHTITTVTTPNQKYPKGSLLHSEKEYLKQQTLENYSNCCHKIKSE